jgi:7,8-dihydropterin-6-yl-methyl-4-(beta-D-ribofuranosyl)aminobenzene 5'-phosphate synthase
MFRIGASAWENTFSLSSRRPCPLFLGSTVEQGLAINVEERVTVIVSGCGHSTVGNMVQRAERLPEAPLHGILGGFHLPITDRGRLGRCIEYYVTGRLPWDHLAPADSAGIIDLLKRKNIRLLGIPTLVIRPLRCSSRR